MTKPSNTALAAPLKSGWAYKKKKLVKAYAFATFADAFGFMTVAALGIEKRDHHPEWTNVYNQVSVALSTHDAGDVTAKDIELAGFLDHSAADLRKRRKWTSDDPHETPAPGYSLYSRWLGLSRRQPG